MQMQNLNVLLSYLRAHKWHMTSFLFKYKDINYIVLFEDLNNLSLTNDGYSVLLTFIDAENINRRLAVKANTFHFKCNVIEFRRYFGIQYSENLGDIFQQFYSKLNSYIPVIPNQNPTSDEVRIIVNQLNQRDNDNNMCCYAVKRNPKINGSQSHRTIFNAEKCRRLNFELYQHFEDDDTISFCFREENELPIADILQNFASRESKRRITLS